MKRWYSDERSYRTKNLQFIENYDIINTWTYKWAYRNNCEQHCSTHFPRGQEAFQRYLRWVRTCRSERASVSQKAYQSAYLQARFFDSWQMQIHHWAIDRRHQTFHWAIPWGAETTDWVYRLGFSKDDVPYPFSEIIPFANPHRRSGRSPALSYPPLREKHSIIRIF